MNRKDREILNAAAKIIAKEMEAGNTVRINGFGKFYTTVNSFYRSHPMGDDWGEDRLRYRRTVRFKPFKGLRDVFPVRVHQAGLDVENMELESPEDRKSRPYYPDVWLYQ